jgi:UDP-N-acetylglucosamine:LPS N-acetylglucosamine transferase
LKILIAPLNWGLGHATRCMPIIEELRRQGAEVILASDGAAYDLLKREYPDLPIHLLPAYDIRYPFSSMVFSMAIQMPKILRGAIGEHFWLKKFLKNTPVDVVISDNRYGFFSRQTRSIFMTHQVNILIPMRLFQPIVNWVNHFFIKRFDACWIPDFEESPNLAGILSHGNFSKKLNVKYLGALSRFKKQFFETRYTAAIVLSGPEPQRSILEKKIRQELSEQQNSEANYILIRGTRSKNDVLDTKIPNLEIHDVLTSTVLNQKILESAVVICRSGYSSIMDLVYLQKVAILIPTPGQTEQEYLATELMRQKQFFSQTQAEFDMQTALTHYAEFKNFRNFDIETETLKEIISELLKN